MSNFSMALQERGSVLVFYEKRQISQNWIKESSFDDLFSYFWL